MEYSLKNLIKVSSNSDIGKDIARAAIRYCYDKEILRFASDSLGESFLIDVNELESLLNPEKFDFQDEKIERVEVEVDDE